MLIKTFFQIQYLKRLSYKLFFIILPFYGIFLKVGQDMLQTNTPQAEKLFDLNQLLPVKSIGYSCTISEFDECEKDCRRVLSQEFKNTQLLIGQNRPLPSYNLFESTESRRDRTSGEYVCTRYGKVYV